MNPLKGSLESLLVSAPRGMDHMRGVSRIEEKGLDLFSTLSPVREFDRELSAKVDQADERKARPSLKAPESKEQTVKSERREPLVREEGSKVRAQSQSQSSSAEKGSVKKTESITADESREDASSVSSNEPVREKLSDESKADSASERSDLSIQVSGKEALVENGFSPWAIQEQVLLPFDLSLESLEFEVVKEENPLLSSAQVTDHAKAIDQSKITRMWLDQQSLSAKEIGGERRSHVDGPSEMNVQTHEVDQPVEQDKQQLIFQQNKEALPKDLEHLMASLSPVKEQVKWVPAQDPLNKLHLMKKVDSESLSSEMNEGLWLEEESLQIPIDASFSLSDESQQPPMDLKQWADSLWVSNQLNDQGLSASLASKSNLSIDSLDGIEKPLAAQMRSHLVDDMKPLISKVHVHQTGGEMTLSLKPAHLGLVRVQVEVNEGHVRVSVQAQQDSARTMLQGQVGELKAQLNTMGLQVDEISVSSIQGSSDTMRSSESETRREASSGQQDLGKQHSFEQRERRDQSEQKPNNSFVELFASQFSEGAIA